jgi:Spy/CpxP family protein refolding chaperone
MKRLLTVFAVIFVAAVWMTGSWLFFNTLAVGAQGSGTPAAADVEKAAPKDETAAKEHCGKWKGHGRHGFFKELNLTDAQKQQIKAIRAEESPKMKPLGQQLKAGRDQLNALMKSGPFDEAKVRSIAKGQADTLTELIVAKERMKSRIYAVLTPEQRAKAEQIRESWKAKKAKHEKGPVKEE